MSKTNKLLKTYYSIIMSNPKLYKAGETLNTEMQKRGRMKLKLLKVQYF